MEGEYDRNRAGMGEDLDAPLGEDGPVEGAGVEDRGLFGRRHGHGSHDGEYASEAGGGGHRGRPPMPYDGGYGDGAYGGYEQRRPPPEGVYEGGYGGSGGYGGGAPPVDGETAAASDLVYGGSDVGGEYGDRGRRGERHGHSEKDDDVCDDERKHKHYAGAAAAAAVGYGLYERHEKNDAEERLEELERKDHKKYDY